MKAILHNFAGDESNCTQYKLSAKIAEKDNVVDRRRQLAGCFVLLTNVAPEGDDGYSAEKNESTNCLRSGRLSLL